MKHDLSLVLGGVGLVRGDIRESGPVMVEITREINEYLRRDDFLKGSPFKLLSGIVRFGTKFDPYAALGRINSRHKELQFAVEVDIVPLKRASKQEVKAAFLSVLIPAIFRIAATYHLPTRELSDFSRVVGVPYADS